MKKIGKLKKHGLAFTALSVSAALLGGGLACSMPYGASAENTPSAGNATAVTVFEDLTVPTEADYGDTVKIPEANGAQLKVTAPDGTEVDIGTVDTGYYSVVVNQIGKYSVTYYNGDDDKAAYSFGIDVSLEEDYFLKVDNNGAGIPTRIQKDGSFELPSAQIAYYDENNILRLYKGDVNWTIQDSFGKSDYAFGDKVEAKNNGKLYVTYSAQIENNGKKYFSETFEVNVQSSLSDKQAPSLTISGITSSVSVNRAVTLPVATVSDDYDENPLVEITVTYLEDGKTQKVRAVDIDEYGYAYQDADKLAADAEELAKDKPDATKLNYPEIAFDNKDVMTFYPLVEGQYNVKYVAYDDAGNVSSSKSWTMTAGDSVAPVFQDIDDWKIPAKWGVNVTDKDGNKVDSAVEIPIPFLVDNKDHMPKLDLAEGEEDTDIVSLYVRITDADNNRDILTFTNVLAKPEEEKDENDNKVTYKGACTASNSVYDGGATQVFSYYSDEPFKFDFSKYDKKDKDNEDESLTGTYTVYYRASDAKGNRSTRQFNIVIDQLDYSDKNAPVIDKINLPKYISTADTTFNIPSVIATDAESTTVHKEYKIYSDNGGADEEGGLYITVDGGEIADIAQKEDGLYLVINKDKPYEKSLKLGEHMYFNVKATDSVGNVATNLDEESEEAEEYKKSKDVVRVILEDTVNEYSYKGAIDFKPAEEYDAKSGAVSKWGSEGGDVYVGDKVLAGNFEIALTDADMRKYTGFEVSVVNSADDSTVETSLETYTIYEDGGAATIYVKNLQFKPLKAGKHYLTVRVFDVNGKNSVYIYTLDVKDKATSGGGVMPSAAIIPDSTGSLNVKYTLHEIDDHYAGAEVGATYYHAHKIRGFAYSLMGNEFTAKSESSYSIEYGFVEKNAGENNYSDLGESFLSDGVKGGTSTFSITDNEKPVIEIQGVLPTYAEKNATVKIPSIIAYSANGAANVKIEVTSSGGDVKLTKVLDENDNETNEYEFVGEKDGVYTIKVTANRGDNQAEASYTVNIGDVVAPEFTVSGGTVNGGSNVRKTQGDEFTYGTIKLANEDEKNVQITKTIYDPSGAEVSGATVSGSYSSYKDKTNNGSTITLDKSGTYKIVYTVKDSVGNEDPYIEYVTVSATGSSTPTTFTTLSTVLIIIAVVLLAGVIIYVVRFRKVKK